MPAVLAWIDRGVRLYCKSGIAALRVRAFYRVKAADNAGAEGGLLSQQDHIVGIAKGVSLFAHLG